MENTALKVDKIGILASTLCMVHCVATPFIFVAQTCTSTCCENSPTWWSLLDFAFLIISFFAINKTTKTTSSTWIKYALWTCWGALFLVISNEYTQFISISENAKHFPALLLITLHFYNLRYCQCNSGECCSNSSN